MPPGYNVVRDGGLPIDLQVNDRGYDVTIVSLHGAVTPDFRLPYMAGQGVTKDIPANRIFISDPSLMLDPGLNLAWFAGSSRQRVQSALQAILQRIIDDRPEVRRWIFFGSSGGGFASLFFASRFPGSYAVVSNPQTSIAKYSAAAVENYARIAFGIEGANPITRIPIDVIDDLVSVYRRPVDTTVLYAQNAADHFHLVNHAAPFFEALHPENRVWWLRGEDWGAGHTAPPKTIFEAILRAAVDPDVIGSAERLGFVRASSVRDLGMA
ncbi:hypothetical protein SAMN04489719_2124 [Agrococcus carbonis]|uniref:Alpha/beta hydrolase family protein n=1 Tax=Agrococcus carbonis TaxID=684552 RepID=A0A1H1RHR0_9MICO|nr:hypothetical protein SAMN04489719_2124 [Agrococcus carbonis]